MAGSVIVIDSSPEPEPVEHHMQAAPIVGDEALDDVMTSQPQSGLKNKGKQKAPAPVVYEISSDDSETAPTDNNNDDEAEVQFTGTRFPPATAAGLGSASGMEWRAEESKKRKRASDLTESPIESGLGAGSGPGTASLSAGGSSSFNVGSSSASGNGTMFGTNTIPAAGPSRLPSLSSFLRPAVKRARFDAGSVAPAGTSPVAATAEHTHPSRLVVPLDRAAASASTGLASGSNNREPSTLYHSAPAPAPRTEPHRALPPGPRPGYLDAHPPGPAYEGALLPQGHFYHDHGELPPRAPPPPHPAPPGGPPGVAVGAVNTDNGLARAEDIFHRVREQRNMFAAGNHQAAHVPANQAYNYNPAFNHNPAWNLAAPNFNAGAALAAGDAELNQRVELDLAGLRQRFPGAFGLWGAQDRDIERQVEAEMARVQERVQERLRAAEAERANWRLQYQRHVNLERQRELERLRQRTRDGMANQHRGLFDFGGGEWALGPEQDPLAGGYRGVGLRRPNANANDLMNDNIDDALGVALNALNRPLPYFPMNDDNMGIRNRLDNIAQDLGDLDNDLDDIGNGIDNLQDDLQNALANIDGRVNDDVGNADNNDHGGVNNDNADNLANNAGGRVGIPFRLEPLEDVDDGGSDIEMADLDGDLDLNNGMYANPLFARAVAAAPPAPPINGPVQDAARRDVINMNRDEAVPDEASYDEDDIYVDNHEMAHRPANPPAYENVTVAAAARGGPVNAGSAAPDQENRATGMLQPVAGPAFAAGPSTTPTATGTPIVIDVDALQHVPAAAHATPVAGPSDTARASASNPATPSKPFDPVDAVLASILEVVPDVLPEHAATLARTHFPSFGIMHTADHVLGLLLESKDYPRRGKGKRKEKAKNQGQEEKESAQGEENGDGHRDAGFKVKVKPATLYKRLVIYHLRQSFPHARASQLSTASAMRYALAHAYLAERLGPAPQTGNAHNADAGAGNDARAAHRHRHRLEEIRAQHYGVPTRAGFSRATNAGIGMGFGMPLDDDRYNRVWEVELGFKMEEEREALRGVVDKEFAKERRWVERRYGLPKSDIGTGASAEGGGEGASGPRTDTGVGKRKVMDNGKGKGKAKEVALADAEDEPIEEGTGVECQCCFAEYSFSRMAQCPEAHLFCVSCISQYAAVQLGNMNPSLTCMHADGCGMDFGELELRRVLPRKLMRLYERVLSQKAVEGLEGLEACPFCEWKCVLDVPPEVDRLFRCENVRADADDGDEEDEDECGVVSCRLCKKLDHTPKNCKEAEEDKHLDGQHAVEEAMTAALMRNCPKCKKAFIKEGGCNKMTCPYCGTHSCYTCRKQITGYDHFDLRPLDPGEPVAAGKCRTHDTRQLEEIHAHEVKVAAEKALAEYKAAHPDADDDQIKVDIPEAPPAPPNNRQNRQNAFGLLGPHARGAAMMAAGQNIFGNGLWGGVGGGAAPPNIPGWGDAGWRGNAGWGGAGPGQWNHNPQLGQEAPDHLAILAAREAVQRHHMRLRNGAGNPQPGVALVPPPPQHRPAVLRPPRRLPLLVPPPRQDNNPMAHMGGAQPQGQAQLPPPVIGMAEGPPLDYYGLRQRRIQEMMVAARARGAAAPQPQPRPQAPVQPAPRPPVYPNFFLDRPDVPAPPQPRTNQLQQATHHDHLARLARQGIRALPPAANHNVGLGGLDNGNERTYPFLPGPRFARQENAVAGPAYPVGDPRGVLPPTRRVSLVAHPIPTVVPAPVANIPRAAGLDQNGVIGMGMGFGAGMEMGMGFGAGMGMGLNMGMHMGAVEGAGAGMGTNVENRQENPLQGQSAAETGAAPHRTTGTDHRMRPY